jgi:hypothetical protein
VTITELRQVIELLRAIVIAANSSKPGAKIRLKVAVEHARQLLERLNLK